MSVHHVFYFIVNRCFGFLLDFVKNLSTEQDEELIGRLVVVRFDFERKLERDCRTGIEIKHYCNSKLSIIARETRVQSDRSNPKSTHITF
jgi:hypothetical protein